MKKKHGWVLYASADEHYVNTDFNSTRVIPLRNARVFSTRLETRGRRLDTDRVRKVSLTLKGKAKKIIGRG